MASLALFQIGQRVRIISQHNIIALNTGISLENDLHSSTGTVMSTLTVSPGYYTVQLDLSNIHCIVFENELEALTDAPV